MTKSCNWMKKVSLINKVLNHKNLLQLIHCPFLCENYRNALNFHALLSYDFSLCLLMTEFLAYDWFFVVFFLKFVPSKASRQFFVNGSHKRMRMSTIFLNCELCTHDHADTFFI